jgi:hypothetical protein
MSYALQDATRIEYISRFWFLKTYIIKYIYNKIIIYDLSSTNAIYTR